MSLLAPDMTGVPISDPSKGLDPNLGFAMSALGGLVAIYFLLGARIHRVELAHKIVAARGGR